MYSFPSLLTLGLPLLALPALIHLINLLRHRRVKWAAMDFLLASQKRHRKWIVFKQLLLVLLRTAAFALVVFMLAQPVVRNEWSELFGGGETHHVVLLDDSYSMTDRRSDGPAFERARLAVLRLAEQAIEQGGQQRFTVLRFSGRPVGELAHESPLDADFLVRLKAALDATSATETAAGPADALDALSRLPARGQDETRVLYLVSDFRARDWDAPSDLRAALDKLDDDGVKLHFVSCVEAVRRNLALAGLNVRPGTQASGVEMALEVAVANHGAEPERNISIKLEEDGTLRPGLKIDEIEPGETVTREFRANFPTAGQHTVTAALPADAVEADNDRRLVVDVAESVPVLIIDGSLSGRDGKQIATALAPGGNVRTGLAPQVERPSYLRQPEALERFPVVYLANIEHLDDTEIKTLESFVRAGGGIGFFTGELTDGEFVTAELHRGGAGLFPAPLGRSTDLLDDRLTKAPDVAAEPHPIFAVCQALRNNPLDDVRIVRYFSVPGDWRPQEDSTVRIIARLRSGAPLVLEKTLGQGRVVAVLTKASSEAEKTFGRWNNWSGNYSYPPTLLSLQGYLAAGSRADESLLVGSPVDVEVDSEQFQTKVRFITPRVDETGPVEVEAAKVNDRYVATLPAAEVSGIYIAELTAQDGATHRQRLAVNVAPEEGRMPIVSAEQLVSRLDGLTFAAHSADALNYAPESLAGVNLGPLLFYVLVAVLLGEQLLAYSASYHPRREADRA